MEFVSDTIADAWEASIYELLKDHKWIPTQRGMRAIELRNVLFTIKSPDKEPIVSSKYQFNKRFIETYCNSIRDTFPGDSIKSRLYNYDDKIDQISMVLKELQRDWFTRRAVISLWNPTVDSTSSHPPCTVVLQFLFREGKLHLTSVLRSNDAWMAALPDMIALSRIQAEMAKTLNVEIGIYTQMSVSYHIYEPDVMLAEEIFKRP